MKFISRSLLLINMVLLLTLASTAQIKLTDPLPKDPSVRIGKLSNGLTYYIRKNQKPEKKLELRLAINAGSVLENEDQRGLAHFMEHMGFNGSKNFPKNELVDFLQKSGVAFGADLNAYTGFDETVYILPIPTDEPTVVEQGFTVLEDWAFNNLFDKDEIEKERGVVLEESRLSKGSDERMRRLYFPKLFNGSKYAERLPIGKDEILKNFSPATLTSFYKNWYRPGLMAVIVVGDIDPAEAEKKIIAHFGKFKDPAGAPARPSIIPIKARTGPEAMVVTDPEATNTFIQLFNFVKPARKLITWANYREALVEDMVSSLINQRLTELTQKENPPFIYANTSFSEFIRGYDGFNSFAVLGQGTAQEALDALISETNRAKKFGFLAAELDRVKSNLINQSERSVTEKDKLESGAIVGSYVNNFLEGSPIVGVENRAKFLKQFLPGITLAEINAAAAKMPGTNNAFALVQAPESLKSTLPDNAGLLKAVVAASNKTVTAYEEKAVAGKLLDKDPVAGSTVSQTTNEKLKTTDFTLSNGATITIKPTTNKNDEILMDAWRLGGFQKFDLADKSNAQYAAVLVNQMGVKDMDPTDIRKFLAGKSLSVSPYINDYEEGIEGRTSVRDLETFLQLLNLYFTQPRKDAGAFKSFVTKQKSSIQFLKQNPQAFYQDTLARIAYNNNPWASSIPTVEDFDKLDLNKSFDIYKQIFENAYGMHFTFVGNVDPATLKPLLEKYIGSLPGTQKEIGFKDNGVRQVPGLVEVNLKKGKESQSMVTLQFEGPAEYKTEDRTNLQALIAVLNIKVIEKLREEMSGIYGGSLYGNIVKRPYPHYIITASFPCGPENVPKLTAALEELIRSAQEKGVDQKDLDKVKETWKKQYHVGLQSNDYWLTVLSNAFIDQTNPENVLTYEKRVDAVTVADVQNAAKKFLTLNSMVKVALYPENVTVPEPKKAF
jgi:zinc protease